MSSENCENCGSDGRIGGFYTVPRANNARNKIKLCRECHERRVRVETSDTNRALFKKPQAAETMDWEVM